jgi:hypothetical protein
MTTLAINTKSKILEVKAENVWKVLVKLVDQSAMKDLHAFNTVDVARCMFVFLNTTRKLNITNEILERYPIEARTHQSEIWTNAWECVAKELASVKDTKVLIDAERRAQHYKRNEWQKLLLEMAKNSGFINAQVLRKALDVWIETGNLSIMGTVIREYGVSLDDKIERGFLEGSERLQKPNLIEAVFEGFAKMRPSKLKTAVKWLNALNLSEENKQQIWRIWSQIILRDATRSGTLLGKGKANIWFDELLKVCPTMEWKPKVGWSIEKILSDGRIPYLNSARDSVAAWDMRMEKRLLELESEKLLGNAKSKSTPAL